MGVVLEEYGKYEVVGPLPRVFVILVLGPSGGFRTSFLREPFGIVSCSM